MTARQSVPSSAAIKEQQDSVLARSAGMLAIGCFAYYVGSVLLLHILRPDYAPLYRAVSDYAVGRFSVVMTLAFIARGAGTVALAVALSRALSRPARSAAGLALLYGVGICYLLLAFFPTNLEHTPETTAARIHAVVALLGFIGTVSASLLLSRAFARDERWRALAPAAWTLALLSVAALIFAIVALAVELSASQGGFFGLAERVFIVVTLSWLLLVSIGCARRTSDTTRHRYGPNGGVLFGATSPRR